MSNVIEKTIEERGKVYGDPQLSHENIGLCWTAAIQQHYGIKLDHPMPTWLVALMMVQFKCQRASRVFHADNFVDAHAYLNFAEEGQKTIPKEEKKIVYSDGVEVDSITITKNPLEQSPRCDSDAEKPWNWNKTYDSTRSAH